MRFQHVQNAGDRIRQKIFLAFFIIFWVFPAVHPVSGSSSGTIRRDFYRLRQQCLQTLKDPRKLKSRSNVQALSRACLKFQREYPTTSYAARSLYLSGMLWEGLYRHTRYVADWNQALRSYGKVLALYPRSWLADDALFRSGELYMKLGLNLLALKDFEKLLERYPNSDLKSITKARIRLLTREKTTERSIQSSKPRVRFKGFRYWSNRKYARLVMDFTDKVDFRFKLKKTTHHTNLLLVFNKPVHSQKGHRTLYGKRGDYFRKASFHVSPHAPPVIRASFGAYAQCRVFTLLSPFRVVVDAIFQGGQGKICPERPPRRGAKDFTICLDPGHGGKDPGATGPHGIHEKDIVLRIARILRDKLIHQYGFKVIMTRNRDVYIPLEERVAFANSHGADLFISIHINASRNRRLQGISTFCLSNTSDRKSLRLAARENGIPLSKMSSVEKILNDMLFCEKYNESYQVAHVIHRELMRTVHHVNPYIRDLGVRFAPFYVLAGAKMPSILLELDFISNPYGEKRLEQKYYLNTLAQGIAEGILKTTQTIHIARNFN